MGRVKNKPRRAWARQGHDREQVGTRVRTIAAIVFGIF